MIEPKPVDPAQLIGRLQLVPYEPGAGRWDGADCWGLVELWFEARFGIRLDDRGQIAPGPEGLAQGFASATERGWIEVETPQDDDLVILPSDASGKFGKALKDGHCGVFHQGKVVHATPGRHCVCDPWESRLIAPRVTAILRHPLLVAPDLAREHVRSDGNAPGVES